MHAQDESQRLQMHAVQTADESSILQDTQKPGILKNVVDDSLVPVNAEEQQPHVMLFLIIVFFACGVTPYIFRRRIITFLRKFES